MTSQPIVSISRPVCLVGGAPLSPTAVAAVAPLVGAFVAVDGGADHLMQAGITPAAVIGDLDSLSDQARDRFRDVLHQVAEQSTTDFEKALTRVASPLVFLLGMTGGRIDHMLSVLNVMARFAERAILLVDAEEVSFIAPFGTTVMDLPRDAAIALMPVGRAQVSATGLKWPFSDQPMTPDGFTSPSNRVDTGPVTITTDGPVLVTLPLAFLPQAVQAAARAG